MNIRYLSSLYIFISVVIFTSCATPVPPTGGPPDRTPPAIERSDPESGTVNFDRREVRIAFSKFINRSSLVNAVEIEPDLAIGYDVSWGRRTVSLEFDSDLPENTTIIITIGTELQDMRGNNLAAPYQLALSTGPEIDDGKVTAAIRRATDGSSDSGYRLFLYREPFDLSAPANYVAETDTGGTVEFSYLAEDSYKAIWVDDLNRNRIWDWRSEAAQPFPDSTFTLGRGDDEYDLGTIHVHEPDTTRPELRGVGLLTENRLRMRFSEIVYWDDDSVIQVSDSLGNVHSEAYPIYALQEDPLVVIAQSLENLDEDQLFDIELEGFYDEEGNPGMSDINPFAGSAQPDTVRLRIIGDNTEPGLYNDEPLIIGYNKFIDDEDVADSLRIVEGDAMIEEWPHFDIHRHRLTISPDGQWERGLDYQYLVWNPDREQLRPLEPVIWQRNDLGAIEIVLTDTSEYDHYLTMFDEHGKVRVDTTFTESIEIDQLPPLSYTAIVFRDNYQTGRWESGAIMPFQAPEPYFVRSNIPVREGFTSELEVTFPNQPNP